MGHPTTGYLRTLVPTELSDGKARNKKHGKVCKGADREPATGGKACRRQKSAWVARVQGRVAGRESHPSFAAAYRIPLSTLKNWEQGRRMPDAPAAAYLLAIKRRPKGIMEAVTRP